MKAIHKPLSEWTTEELVKEIEKRNGVYHTTLDAGQYDHYNIHGSCLCMIVSIDTMEEKQ